MDKHPIGELMEITMQKIREMVDVNTVIGQPITTADDITLIPISNVSFGFASGGSDFQGKKSDNANFGGGSGAGVKITPMAFIVVKEGGVRILNVNPPAANTVDRIVEMAPDIVDKVAGFVGKDKK
ncbi:MAG: GerW family sporulation protein [Oscillospiraceae bacterium]|nr:GerW family sporulation protein [Oscillospiraceae bacterium]